MIKVCANMVRCGGIAKNTYRRVQLFLGDQTKIFSEFVDLLLNE
jgi:hypothetical protein